MAAVELAPAVVVRVAGWPIAAIDALADARVAALAARVQPGGVEWSEYLAAYAEAIEAQRRRLWQRTVGDPRFVRALALASPAVAAGVIGRELPPRRNKAARHLETTLYRYLARAVSRTEPCGLWAGATLARWGARRRCRATERVEQRVAPDLAPFRSLCARLAAREPYAERGPYKLNPTLLREADGTYLFWSAPGRRPSTRRRMAGGARIDAVVAVLESRDAWARPDAVRAIVEQGSLPAAEAAAVIERLCEVGVLVGGLAFPRRFTDAWEALRMVEAWLEPEHARAWAEARARLRSLAESLAEVLAREGEASAILEALEAARAVVVTLASALGIDGVEAPRTALRCDTAAAWAVELGPDDADALRSAIACMARYEDAEGLHGPLVRAAVRRVLGASPDGALARVEPASAAAAREGSGAGDAWAALDDDGELVARRERMQRRLRATATDVHVPCTGRDVGPTLAALHVSLACGSVGGQPLVHGLGLDATAAYARLAGLLEGERGGVLGGWLRDRYREVAERTGVDFAALLHDHATPNVLAQPALVGAVLDPWGLAPGRLPDRGLRVHVDPERGWPVVAIPGRARPVVVIVPTAATPPADDACVHALLLTSLHLPPMLPPGARAARAGDGDAPRLGPRLRLDDGTVIRTRKTELVGEPLASLTTVSGAERFARWQRLAASHGWPRRLLVARDGGPPLLVDRDGPLAIEAAFEGSRGARRLHVEEFVRDAWIGDDDDERRYVADLVLPFVRDLDSAGAHPFHAGMDPARCGARAARGIVAAE